VPADLEEAARLEENKIAVEKEVLACSFDSRKRTRALPSSTAYRSDRGLTGPASAPFWEPLKSGQVTNRI
jgi:hypothetical protein